MSDNKLLLIDCDILQLRYSHGSIEARHPFLEGEFVPAPSDQICRLVDELIANSLKACGTDKYLCVLSGHGNFRTEIAKQAEYKGNRDPSKPRPHHFETVGEHIRQNHPHIVIEGHEADDYMGYAQYDNWKPEFEKEGFSLNPDNLTTIIASRDKDLRTVQGWHYSWACGDRQPEKPLYYISPSKGMYQFFYQMLIGDTTDNIIGCGKKELVPWGKEKNEDGELVPKMMLRRKGIGDKAAQKILSSCVTVLEMKSCIFEEYEALFGEGFEDILLENAHLLFIGQKPDKLFEWSWLDKYMSLDNDNYVDPDTVPKKTRKGNTKSVEVPPEETPIPKLNEEHKE